MSKNKGVPVAVSSSIGSLRGLKTEGELKDAVAGAPDAIATASASSAPVHKSSGRNASSKYDFVKIKVWLGENADHYYVLSRFLLSRMLTVTKIPNHVAVKIALELKKLLIDNSLLDVSQLDLEANLFKLMERRGYGEEYINRYKMMTRFHYLRVPLVILVCGTACVGKSTIATQLAQRLNLPNVLQTDMVYELLRTSTDAPLTSTPLWARDFNSSEELITEFCRECRIVRKGLAGDLKKAMKDGKPIIIEGMHLDPSIYLMDDENKAQSGAADKEKTGNPAEISSGNADSLDKEMQQLELVDAAEPAASSEGDAKQTDSGTNPPKYKPTIKPIIVPIVLKMTEFDHTALLEEWTLSRAFSDKCVAQEKEKAIANVRTIQEYLCSFESQGMTIANVSANTFLQTLDKLHEYLLQRIEEGISSASPAGK